MSKSIDGGGREDRVLRLKDIAEKESISIDVAKRKAKAGAYGPRIRLSERAIGFWESQVLKSLHERQEGARA